MNEKWWTVMSNVVIDVKLQNRRSFTHDHLSKKKIIHNVSNLMIYIILNLDKWVREDKKQNKLKDLLPLVDEWPKNTSVFKWPVDLILE